MPGGLGPLASPLGRKVECRGNGSAAGGENEQGLINEK